MLFMQLNRIIPRHKFAFEYIIWLFAAALDFYMPYFMKQNGKLYLCGRILLGHMYLVQCWRAQSIVFSKLWIYKQLYSETLAVIRYKRIYFCFPHFSKNFNYVTSVVSDIPVFIAIYIFSDYIQKL